jgi:hypothetical protein
MCGFCCFLDHHCCVRHNESRVQQKIILEKIPFKEVFLGCVISLLNDFGLL